MKSECCQAEVSAYFDEDYNKVFYTCLQCEHACTVSGVDNSEEEGVDTGIIDSGEKN